MRGKRIILFSGIFLLPLILIFSQCSNLFDKQEADPRGNLYAGYKSCMKCHSDVYKSYLHTAHFQSTRDAADSTVQGDFSAGHNSFTFNDSLKVVMEKRKDGLYQVGYINNKKQQEQRFDIAFGGVKAETYLYWKDSTTYQLPISYFKRLHNWTNSPGYDTTRIDFGRMIGKRCFECHSSYIKQLPSPQQSLASVVKFDQATLINGIDCERCHGPAANHVNFHTDYPEEKKARYITNYASLSRQQKIDMCASCHSGNSSMPVRSMFAFKPGDTLSNFLETEYYPTVRTGAAQLDVHGNQSQMLGASQCFIQSKMDCGTCHNTHVKDRGNIALYSQRCMNCHKADGHNFCKMASKIGVSIKNNCVNCHMPERPSAIIAVQTSAQGRAAPYFVRTHRIAVYPQEVEKVLSYINKK